MYLSTQVVGEDRCPIVDTYWQTETGAHVLAPIPGVWPAKPGSATLPFFGVQPAMVNEQVRKPAQYLLFPPVLSMLVMAVALHTAQLHHAMQALSGLRGASVLLFSV